MSAHSRRKDLGVERELVQLLREAGVPAERVSLSGAADGSFTGDVMIAGRWRAEVKAWAAGAGFKTLERCLGGDDLLVLRRDRQEPMVLLPWPLPRALRLAYWEMCREAPAAAAVWLLLWRADPAAAGEALAACVASVTGGGAE